MAGLLRAGKPDKASLWHFSSLIYEAFAHFIVWHFNAMGTYARGLFVCQRKLNKALPNEDVEPNENLYIQFISEPKSNGETITYHTIAGGLIVLDLYENGTVVGLEIF
jgi:hypothetical protein